MSATPLLPSAAPLLSSAAGAGPASPPTSFWSSRAAAALWPIHPLLLAGCVLSLAGCANPGPLRPPSLNLPAPVTDLRAERVGDAVRLTWTTSSRTTDKLPVRGPIFAELCRTGSPRAASGSAPAQAQPPSPPRCDWTLDLSVAPGPSAASDPLTGSDLRSGAARLLGYRVRLVNRSGRAAGDSPVAFAASGKAPSPVLSLAVAAHPRGAELTWQRAGTTDASVELTRAGQPESSSGSSPGPAKPDSAVPGTHSSVEPASSASAPEDGSSAPAASGSPAAPDAPPVSAPPPPRPAKHSRAPALSLARNISASAAPAAAHLLAAPAGPDPGGALDTSAPFGTPLVFRAQRVQTVTLDGHQLTLRSELSPPVAVILRDTFPPAPPAGLLAADGTLPNSGATPAASAVDLSWEPGAEPDLAGYLVERRYPGTDATTSTWQQLTPEPIASSGFHDPAVRAGVPLQYRVSAVDGSGNRSAPTPAVSITLPGLP